MNGFHFLLPVEIVAFAACNVSSTPLSIQYQNRSLNERIELQDFDFGCLIK
jgi:hypothetical protein